ncbi:hypothetical protein GW17_00023569 [Ensete ventricosum]|nr:hypothetical protein GW17_00023569 [Ensete ventricosum]
MFSFFRYSITKAFCVAFVMTLFSMFDVPVFWPILVCYWIVLFFLTMKRQIVHMIKYKYVPFNIGKKVSTIMTSCVLVFFFKNIFIAVVFQLKLVSLVLNQRYGAKMSHGSSSISKD